MASATVADSKLSSAARAATATAGASSTRRSVHDMAGNWGPGSYTGGRAPMRATDRFATEATIVASTTEMSATGTVGRRRVALSISPATPNAQQRGPLRVTDPLDHRIERGEQHVLAGDVDAQCRRDLLQADDDGDAEREALDDR